MLKVCWIIEISKVEFSNFCRTERVKQKKKKKKKKKENYRKPRKLVRQSLVKQLQRRPNIFLVFHWKFNPFTTFDPPCGSITTYIWTAISQKRWELALFWPKVFYRVFHKLSSNIQVDRLWNCGSLVVDV